jgi:hypothetical protein
MLRIRDPTDEVVRQAWTCEVCRSKNVLQAKWLVVEVLRDDQTTHTGDQMG